MKLTHPDGKFLILSDDLLWTDEFDWSDLAQTDVERTLSGAYIVQQGVKVKGRPITLAPPDDSMAWHTRQVVQTLQEWAKQPATVFTLEMAQGVFAVIFDNSQNTLSAVPVFGFGGTEVQDMFRVTVKFLTA